MNAAKKGKLVWIFRGGNPHEFSRGLKKASPLKSQKIHGLRDLLWPLSLEREGIVWSTTGIVVCGMGEWQKIASNVGNLTFIGVPLLLPSVRSDEIWCK